MNPVTKPKAVLFDWDNTLIDSWAVIHAALNETFRQMGHANWTRAETEARVRGSLRDTFPAMFSDRWREAEKIFYDAFGKLHLERLIPLPGADALLKQLAASGIYLGVVSNKRGSFLRLEAEKLGWHVHFHRLAGAGDSGHDKPHRDHVDHALGVGTESAGPVASPEVWFVGDADIDMLCAKNAGCTAVLVRALPPTEDEFLDAPPDLHFVDIAALAAYLSKP